MLFLLLTVFVIIGKNFELYFASVLPIFGYHLLTLITKTESVALWCYQGLLLLIPIILGVFVVYFSQRDIEKIMKVMLLSLGVTAITTMIGVYNYPSASRYLATVSDANDSFNVLLEWHNVGGYQFVYTLVLLYPMWIFLYKRRRFGKITLCIGIAVVFFTAVLTEYTTAFLLLIVSSMLLLFKRDVKTRDIVLFAVFLLVAALFMQNLLTTGLQWLGDVINSKTMSARILALSGGTAGLENFEDNRYLLYQNSLYKFIDSPIIGNMFSDTHTSGGHSAILDTLAQFGLVGGFLVILFYKKIYKLFYKPFEECEGYGFYLWTFIQAVILSTLNTGFWIPVISLYAPIIFASVVVEKGHSW